MGMTEHKKKQQQHGGDEAAAAAKERLDRFKAWLMHFDGDGDEHISRRELRDAIRSGGARFATVRAWVNLYLADKNRNGVIDDGEIKHLMDLTEKDLDLSQLQPTPAAARPTATGAPPAMVVVSACQFQTTPLVSRTIDLRKLTAKPVLSSTANN